MSTLGGTINYLEADSRAFLVEQTMCLSFALHNIADRIKVPLTHNRNNKINFFHLRIFPSQHFRHYIEHHTALQRKISNKIRQSMKSTKSWWNMIRIQKNAVKLRLMQSLYLCTSNCFI